jgi:class 3 adenylate cyclase/tetratricopeptide (TPR) repeat protein
MQCPRCQAENPSGMRFCGQCAAPLASVCAACGTANPPANRFCGQCAAPLNQAAPPPKFTSPDTYTPKHLAERILTSKAALEGERKQVTVLFADLKGSMELLADRDPEEARKILDPVLERMMEAVHRYEGTVNQVMGDGIMALFGAPLAHEDHAVRACYAALRMQESVKKYAEEVRRSHAAVVKIRVGLNSGEVVVRSIGSDLHMDYTAVGQTTHLAARMEQLADPGAIVITPDTLALAEGYVEVRSLGPIPVKGLPDPIEIFELTGAGTARTRLQAAVLRGLTRFVGRDAEVEHLRRVLGQASAGHGQVAAIVGEAGVGKSRLVYEFTHSHLVQDWLILEASSVSYGKATSYLPVIDLLKGYFKIGDRDDHREMRAKVLGRVLGLDRALEPLVPPLLALLDVPVEDPAWQNLDSSQRRQRTLDAVKRLLLRESQVQPLLVVFEDLHWVDEETQALLDSLVETLGSARLQLLVTYRPEYEHRWGSKTAYSQLRLDTLLAESAAELLAALLGLDPGLAPLTQMLVRRGNPFFLEETVRTLVETGALAGERGAYRLTRPVEALQVPATVQTILAARIDRLPAEEKQLLQAASVIGKHVPYALLAAIAEQSEEALRGGLAHLQEAEYLYETQLFPDLEYTFKHALTHDVAYAGLLVERRRTRHAAVVAAIERLFPDRLSEQVERLAQHALAAEQWEKTVRYSRQAGVKSVGRHAFQDAAGYLDQALEALRHLPPNQDTMISSIDTRLELVPALFGLSHLKSLLEHLREAERLAKLLDDRQRLGSVLGRLSWTLRSTGELVEAIRTGEQALSLAREIRVPAAEAQAKYYLGQAYLAAGNSAGAISIWTDVIETAPPDATVGAAVPIHVTTRAWLAMALSANGATAEGFRHGVEGLGLAEADSRPFGIVIALGGFGSAYVIAGDFEAGIPLLERARVLGYTAGITNWHPTVAGALARAYAHTGRATEAAPLAESAVNEERVSGALVGMAQRLLDLADVYLVATRTDDALAKAEEALHLARRHGARRIEASSLHQIGEIQLHVDPCGEAGEHLHQAMEAAAELSMRPLVAHCHLGLAKLYRRTGQREQAREHLTTATSMYREMDMRFWLEQAEAELASDRPIVGQTDGL